MNRTPIPIESDTSRPSSTLLPSPIKLTAYSLLLSSLLTGCWAPAIKAPLAQVDKLQSLLVVAVESPPLEISPDPIEKRIPAYGHYRNMAMPVDLDSALYRNADGVIIAGLISPDDMQTMSLASEPGPSWNPAKAIARLAQSKLSAHAIHSVLNQDYHPLPMTDAERNAALSHWHDAIQDWYALENTTADYASLGQFDAVLEVGIANYRIFEGQVSLQVLLKLIDPVSRRVIARSRANTFEVDDAALNSLDHDSQAFKQRIAGMGQRLLNQALGDIGLASTAQAALTVQ